MATNEEVLGPRKTMIVLVIVVGCFAVLWPRILSPLLLGPPQHLEPNQFDRDAGCCEVIFETEVAFLELVSEICRSSVGADGKLSPYAAAECRKSVNETCGVDIAALLKRNENVGKSTKKLFETLKQSNSTCLRENFGVPIWSLSSHTTVNSWKELDTLKQERSSLRGLGPHPALRERGRAIPAHAPTPPSRVPVPLPPHVRVRPSPLSGYFDIEIKPPPIPGMRPPLGSPGGPVTPPKSSMGFVMPIYTICIIVFFVYTLSKILFKRTGSPYETISPDPQFRRRVFRTDSQQTSEPKLVVTAISGLVAEVQQQMEASYAQNQQRQDVQDNHARPYTNGKVANDHVRIIATDYKEPIPELKEPTPEPRELKEPTPEKEESPEPKEPMPEPKEATPEPKEPTPEPKEPTPEPKEPTPEPKEPTPEPKEPTPEPKEPTPEPKEPTPEPKELTPEPKEPTPEPKELTPDPKEPTPEHKEPTPEPEIDINDKKVTEDFLEEARDNRRVEDDENKQTTPELLEEALREMGVEDEEEEEVEEEDEDVEPEKSTVKVLGMETTAHAADGGTWPADEAHMPPAHHKNAHSPEDVKSIFLETEIPQQSAVLITDFEELRAESPPAAKHSPLIVSGKMTLSLIQDQPRETPERDAESTMDEFTTASAVTQPKGENKQDEELSEEEIEEEIEIEEIEEEIEVEEEEEDEKLVK